MTLEELEEKIKKIEELEKKIGKLEELVDKMGKIPPQYYFKIDKVIINEPVLEELTFQLDKLDIKDLSGSLNLGNNFGIKTKEDKKMKEKLKKAQKMGETLEENLRQEKKHNEKKESKNKKKEDKKLKQQIEDIEEKEKLNSE